jgi:predicted small secreted protein
MKKIIVIILVLVLSLSLCACYGDTGTYVNEAGEQVEANHGEVVVDIANADYTITKIDFAATRVSNSSSDYIYLVTAQSEAHIVVFTVNTERYARWNVGDTFSGDLIGKYYTSYDKVFVEMVIGDDAFDVKWYGEVE